MRGRVPRPAAVPHAAVRRPPRRLRGVRPAGGGRAAQSVGVLPVTIADACRRLHTGRTEAELVVRDLRDGYLERGPADKFVES
ncbi:hypothetical protein [Streptomyces olivaceus]|uniref:hypothetical protein n=1 Tax=Streptomyces olivaceus TaxID=47716 RepID=UPI001CCB4047|nr:hypothetical protein [Streptomyces olivaceus]